MTRVLVTGGAGFIGSHVAERLVGAGMGVTVLDDLSGGFVENAPEGATLIHGSVIDAALVNSLFEHQKFDVVYHLAAYAAEGLSPFIRRFNYTNNLIGSVNLINAAVNTGVKRFVFTSSIAVYGCQRPPFTEDMPCRPIDPYGIAKYAVEMDLWEAGERFGLEHVILRPHNVYGPRQNIGDRYRNVVGIFMNQCLKGEPMTVFGDGRQQRAFTYIDDVATGIANAGFEPACYGRAFNIGADMPWSLVHLSNAVAKAMGVPPLIKHLPARFEADWASANHGAWRHIFPDPPDTPLDVGLARMAAWVKEHGARESKAFEHIEVRKGLPPSWEDRNERR